ncbi:hypothetical protein L249_2091 [Ophiocordyceps polyrhachis-furcata BCC 54312]|uniref:Uncharacterized protein n=1 Tax=Ophiocordyceps polyrhachis-furcata BCC 54312 TaxID=1330021 RepID=A0A367LSK6_9HYPO|nr:hypothetical protein L249_2091 [Ophiocordyceps polyrhachis-furcata BCC 54312]
MNMPKRPPIPKPITPDMTDLPTHDSIAACTCMRKRKSARARVHTARTLGSWEAPSCGPFPSLGAPSGEFMTGMSMPSIRLGDSYHEAWLLRDLEHAINFCRLSPPAVLLLFTSVRFGSWFFTASFKQAVNSVCGPHSPGGLAHVLSEVQQKEH